MFKLDKRGQVTTTIGAIAVSALVGVIFTLVFAEFYGGSNKEHLSAGAATMFSMVDFLLASMIVVGIAGGMLYMFARRG